jgi:hypothetical protein
MPFVSGLTRTSFSCISMYRNIGIMGKGAAGF